MKKSKKLLSIMTVLLLIVCMAVPVSAATKISKKKATLKVGQTLQLKVTGTKKKPKWTSSKKSVATVSPKGRVKAKKKGTATITAKVGKKKYTCKVTVKKTSSSSTLKMFLPNQETCGNASFCIEYNSQKCTNGKSLNMKLNKSFPVGYINYSANAITQNYPSRIYIDGKLWDKNTGSSVSGGGSLDDEFISSGTHVVEFVQFENDNRYGIVTEYKRVFYKVSYQ